MDDSRYEVELPFSKRKILIYPTLKQLQEEREPPKIGPNEGLVCRACGLEYRTLREFDHQTLICKACLGSFTDPVHKAEVVAALKEEKEAKDLAEKRAVKKKRKTLLTNKKAKTDLTVNDKVHRELASRELARRSLLHYIERTVPNYTAGWAHEDVCRRLEQFMRDVEAQKSPRLMLALPPRFGKSKVASGRFPAWVLGHHPNWEFILSSYSVDLPVGFSREIRQQVKSREYHNLFPKTSLSADTTAAEQWKTTAGGGLRAAGVGGGITGMGAHIFVIDDPVKDREEAESEKTRTAVKNWYSSTAYTRLAPGGGMLVIQCMVGETPVLMGDGTTKRLDEVRKGDRIATFANGWLSTATVKNWTMSGRDHCYKITTTSGRKVRANARHPFLVQEGGKLLWIRTQNLKSTQQIVVLRGSGENGEVTASKCCRRLSSTSDFTTEGILSVEPDGEDDVFDLQVEGTENFIANGIVAHNTRWHDDDLSGWLESTMREALKALDQEAGELRMLLREARNKEEQTEIYQRLHVLEAERATVDQWEIVSYPALAEFDEYLDRKSGRILRDDGALTTNTRWLRKLRAKGEALHPERFPQALLLKYKRTLIPRDWSALYQQNPTPDEGDFFTMDMFRYRPTLPDLSEMITFVTWDLAVGEKTSNDWTVGIVGALDWEDHLWIVDMIRGRWGDTNQLAEIIIDTHVRYGAQLTGIEKGQLELALRPHLSRVMKQRQVYIPLAEGDNALRPITDKIVRARPLQGRMQQGKVLFPADQPWVETLRNEFLRFPNGSFDDIVDSTSWMARMIAGHQPPAKPTVMAKEHPKGYVPWKKRLHSLMGTQPKNYMAR